MTTKIFSVPIMFCLASGTASCVMAGEKNLYYEYTRVAIETKRGEFSVGIEPEPKLIVVNGYQVESWGQPYRFNAQYYPEGESTVLLGYLSDVKVSSIDTGEAVLTADRIDDVYTKRGIVHQNSQARFLGFGADLRDGPYDDYSVSMKYTIYADEGDVFEEGELTVTIPRNYYEARRRKGVGIL